MTTRTTEYSKYEVRELGLKVAGDEAFTAANCVGKMEEELDVIRKRYEGHEISCHTVNHGWLDKMPLVSIINEVMEDRRILENLAGYPVTGMSYPSGAYNRISVDVLRACGIVYSRTTVNAQPSHEFPEDYLIWDPTCHHKDIDKFIDSFISNLDSQWHRPLFYIWGHAYEFRTEEDWERMEAFVSRLAEHKDKIWFATNIDIYNYVKAQRSLVVSADESMIHNPSAIDVWVEKNKTEVIMIPAGKTVRL
jgi:hypothetical protein